MTSRRTKISPKSGRGLGHVTSTIFGSTVGYPSDSLASCYVEFSLWLAIFLQSFVVRIGCRQYFAFDFSSRNKHLKSVTMTIKDGDIFPPELELVYVKQERRVTKLAQSHCKY